MATVDEFKAAVSVWLTAKDRTLRLREQMYEASRREQEAADKLADLMKEGGDR